MTAPEYRTQVKRWFVETGFCDGGGMGHWIETEESVEVAGEAEANALRDSWLASGKLRTMPWGELRPQNSYALFRIRQVWEDTRAPLAEALAVPTCDRPFIMGANHGYDTALEQVAELLEAMKEVLRISDRDHAAWHRAHAALRAIGERAE